MTYIRNMLMSSVNILLVYQVQEDGVEVAPGQEPGPEGGGREEVQGDLRGIRGPLWQYVAYEVLSDST